jgi:hypothetical protein
VFNNLGNPEKGVDIVMKLKLDVKYSNTEGWLSSAKITKKRARNWISIILE